MEQAYRQEQTSNHTEKFTIKTDDFVNVRSFGANGDGTDQTLALQRAIDQLYSMVRCAMQTV